MQSREKETKTATFLSMKISTVSRTTNTRSTIFAALIEHKFLEAGSSKCIVSSAIICECIFGIYFILWSQLFQFKKIGTCVGHRKSACNAFFINATPGTYFCTFTAFPISTTGQQ